MTNNKELLVKILLKKAKGYVYREKTDEYVVTEGKKQLVKSKVVTKRMQPDVNAVKALLQMDVDDLNVCEMTDEQLRQEKLRLIRLLNECDVGNGATQTDEQNFKEET